MKLAYVVYLMQPRNNQGVLKKIFNQLEAWNKLGHKVLLIFITECKSDVLIPSNQRHVIVEVNTKWSKFFYFRKVYSILLEFNPDIVYSRHLNLVPYLIKTAKRFKYIFEVNSLMMVESKMAKNKSKNNLLGYYWKKLTVRLFYKSVSGFISVSGEIVEKDIGRFNKPVIVIPNSINLDRVKIIKNYKKNSDGLIRLFFIGSANQSWHGVDKIVEFARITKNKTEIHIIGINEPSNITSENVHFYGYKSFDEYKKIISNCHIAIGTLALHRKEMEEASPLKVREYLALGFPVIIGYNDTSFSKGNYPFILQIPNLENNLIDNIDSVLNFCEQNRNIIVQREQINKEIDINVNEFKKLKFLKNEFSA